MKKILFCAILFVLTSSEALAHQPRLVIKESPTKNAPIEISNPEISQVFYGELEKNPEYYSINIKEDQKGYFGILAPISEKELTSVKVYDTTGNELVFLDEASYIAGGYFEDFGGDYYTNGPEKELDLKKGEYLIEIFNKTNTGKYAFVIGKIEQFPLKESLKTLYLLPIIKATFFEKPVLETFLNIFGIVMIIISLIYFLFKDKKYKNIFLIGLPVLLIGSGLLFKNNPVNILGGLKILISILAIISSIYTFLSKKHRTQKVIISMGLYLLILLLISAI